MKITLSRKFTNNGPMIFSRRLFECLTKNHGVKIVDNDDRPDIYFAVISFDKMKVSKLSKVVLRIDGMYWNTKIHNVIKENAPIFDSILRSDGIVFQSEFCKRCFSASLGKIKAKNTVILNAIDFSKISDIPKKSLPFVPGVVASADWRPTKRYKSICNGFLAAKIPHHLYMIGKKPPDAIENKRITWTGPLSEIDGISVMKSCTHAIHLGKFDPCPNSVVEEICCGLPVLHTANGGTPEIVRGNGVRLEEDLNWDYKPVRGVNDIKSDVVALGLESLVKMGPCVPHKELDINYAAQQYYDFFERVLS